MSHHTDEEACPLCCQKLQQAHPIIADWFKRLKARYKNVHISYSFRDQQEQDDLVKEGKSRLMWPNSFHNKTDANRNPQSKALDIFQIDEDGVARFSVPFYKKVNDENVANREPIHWGGVIFKELSDKVHFQMDLSQIRKEDL